MKKLSEVCKITGVTRRTLQEYDKIGLVHPTAKTEGDYWLYDDEAIGLINGIQVFREVGYKRKEIMTVLQGPTEDLEAEYDRVIRMLDEKQERIKGMVRYIRIMKAFLNIPQEVLSKTFPVLLAGSLEGEPFTDKFDGMVSELSGSDYDNDELNAISMEIYVYTIALGIMKEEPRDSLEVKQSIAKLDEVRKRFISELIEILKQEDPDEDYDDLKEELTLPELIEELYGEYVDYIDSLCGEGAFKFIEEAVACYGQQSRN